MAPSTSRVRRAQAPAASDGTTVFAFRPRYLSSRRTRRACSLRRASFAVPFLTSYSSLPVVGRRRRCRSPRSASNGSAKDHRANHRCSQRRSTRPRSCPARRRSLRPARSDQARRAFRDMFVESRPPAHDYRLAEPTTPLKQSHFSHAASSSSPRAAPAPPFSASAERRRYQRLIVSLRLPPRAIPRSGPSRTANRAAARRSTDRTLPSSFQTRTDSYAAPSA